ncbi:hypothetical protein PGTUg99_018932 [Puccinia graminis f. sp. tritici]|uniref:Uncharacterized protein n=1 Tax=Puccinia graminis f. sp. tritici TaxID=56615 RepID=A0A5B0SC78_PUCGR|nr:hypothetical protein PGTUg99_018932 [Puccinia graminis f. sp. tritici]
MSNAHDSSVEMGAVHTGSGPPPRVQLTRRPRDPASASRDPGVQTEPVIVACCWAAIWSSHPVWVRLSYRPRSRRTAAIKGRAS